MNSVHQGVGSEFLLIGVGRYYYYFQCEVYNFTNFERLGVSKYNSNQELLVKGDSQTKNWRVV